MDALVNSVERPKLHYRRFQPDKLIGNAFPLGRLILAPSKINAAEDAQDKS
jgi:hypothetical protein